MTFKSSKGSSLSRKGNDSAASRRNGSAKRVRFNGPESGPVSSSDETDCVQPVRSCDACCRRQLQCSGDKVCSACAGAGLQCSYIHVPDLQARSATYVADLEQKVRNLQADVHKYRIPCQTDFPCCQHSGNEKSNPLSFSATTVISPVSAGAATKSCTYSHRLDRSNSSMDEHAKFVKTVTSTCPGKPLGYDVLRQLWSVCLTANESENHDQHNPPTFPVSALDSTLPFIHGFTTPYSAPPLDPDVLEYMKIATSEVLSMWPLVDPEQIDTMLSRSHQTLTSTKAVAQDDLDELALTYSLLAIGKQFDDARHDAARSSQTRSLSLSYFLAAREIVPVGHCDRSIAALQTTLCLAIYLKVCSALTEAHRLISAAVSAALRLGLHAQIPSMPNSACKPQDHKTNQRVWSAISMLDIYVSSALGIPRTPRIARTALEGANAFALTCHALEEDMVSIIGHARLLDIYGHATDKIFRTDEMDKWPSSRPLTIELQTVEQIADQLDTWANQYLNRKRSLENMNQSELFLSCSYAYLSLMLYSPFAHSLQHSTSPAEQAPEHEYGRKAVNAAIFAMQVAKALHERGNFHHAHFLALDTLIFALVVLMIAEQTRLRSISSADITHASQTAKDLLTVLAAKSHVARVCWDFVSLASGAPISRIPVALMEPHLDPLFDIIQPWVFRPTSPVVPSPDSGLDVSSPREELLGASYGSFC